MRGAGTSGPDVVWSGLATELAGPVRAAELRLVVELSDTNLRFDCTVKAGLYARAGIPDYWILDLNGRRAIVHRDPREGRYESIVSYAADETVEPLAAPGSQVLVWDLL